LPLPQTDLPGRDALGTLRAWKPASSPR
jgi:hypothetical protein